MKGTNEEQEAYVDVSEGGSVPVYWQHANRGTQMMETVIGIDLGTSTTEAAVYRNGNVEMIPNSDGSYVIPSAVGLDEEEQALPVNWKSFCTVRRG